MADATEMNISSSTEDPNEESRMALKQACEEDKPEAVKRLLDEGVSMKLECTTVEDGVEKKSYETCLDVAIDHDNEKVAEAIIKHHRWRESLQIFPGKSDDPPFRKLIQKMPDIAAKVLNQCVTQDKKRRFEFEIDFEILEEFCEQDTESAESSPSDSRKMNILETMKKDLLLHPVVLTLLRWKWLHYMAYFYFANLLFFVVYLSFLTAFALLVPNPLRQICRRGEYNQTESASCAGVSSSRYSFLNGAAAIVIICSLVRLLLKVFEVIDLVRVIKSPSQICEIVSWTHIRTYMEIPLYTLSIAFVSVFEHKCLCPNRGQWQAGIFAVFFAWIDLIFYLNKWPLVGIYIQMLFKILQNFVKVLIMASLLLFAFDLAFYMAFYEPGLVDSPFENPGVTYIQMIAYTVGGPDSSIFGLSNDNSTVEPIPYPGMSYLTWVVFAAVMSVLFLNLLVGLAVEDVQTLRAQAQQNRIKQQVRVLKDTEKWIKIMRLLCICTRNVKMFNHLSPRSDTLTKQVHYWRFINAFIGDEIEDIIDKSSKVLKEKAKWLKE